MDKKEFKKFRKLPLNERLKILEQKNPDLFGKKPIDSKEDGLNRASDPMDIGNEYDELDPDKEIQQTVVNPLDDEDDDDAATNSSFGGNYDGCAYLHVDHSATYPDAEGYGDFSNLYIRDLGGGTGDDTGYTTEQLTEGCEASVASYQDGNNLGTLINDFYICCSENNNALNNSEHENAGSIIIKLGPGGSADTFFSTDGSTNDCYCPFAETIDNHVIKCYEDEALTIPVVNDVDTFIKWLSSDLGGNMGDNFTSDVNPNTFYPYADAVNWDPSWCAPYECSDFYEGIYLQPKCPGCTYPGVDGSVLNYNPEAEIDDGTCEVLACNNRGFANYFCSNQDDYMGISLYPSAECTSLCNANNYAEIIDQSLPGACGVAKVIDTGDICYREACLENLAPIDFDLGNINDPLNTFGMPNTNYMCDNAQIAQWLCDEDGNVNDSYQTSTQNWNAVGTATVNNQMTDIIGNNLVDTGCTERPAFTGCTNTLFDNGDWGNYDPNAQVDDGSCTFEGCLDEFGEGGFPNINYICLQAPELCDPNTGNPYTTYTNVYLGGVVGWNEVGNYGGTPAGTTDDYSFDINYVEGFLADETTSVCSELVVEGCTDAGYAEYSSYYSNPNDLDIEDIGCNTPLIQACLDPDASNFYCLNPEEGYECTGDNALPIVNIMLPDYGGDDTVADAEYIDDLLHIPTDITVVIEGETCIYETIGCMDLNAISSDNAETYGEFVDDLNYYNPNADVACNEANSTCFNNNTGFDTATDDFEIGDNCCCAYDTDLDGILNSNEIGGCDDPQSGTNPDINGMCLELDIANATFILVPSSNGENAYNGGECETNIGFLAWNFNPDATDNDGSCDYNGDNIADGDQTFGCTVYAPDSGQPDWQTGANTFTSPNYSGDATDDDGSCVFYGCPYPASNGTVYYGANVIYGFIGGTNTDTFSTPNLDPNTHDFYPLNGTTPASVINDGSCWWGSGQNDPSTALCFNQSAFNYVCGTDPMAHVDGVFPDDFIPSMQEALCLTGVFLGDTGGTGTVNGNDVDGYAIQGNFTMLSQDDGGTCMDTPPQTSCTDVSDCEDGELCIDGFCVDPDDPFNASMFIGCMDSNSSTYNANALFDDITVEGQTLCAYDGCNGQSSNGGEPPTNYLENKPSYLAAAITQISYPGLYAALNGAGIVSPTTGEIIIYDDFNINGTLVEYGGGSWNEDIDTVTQDGCVYQIVGCASNEYDGTIEGNPNTKYLNLQNDNINGEYWLYYYHPDNQGCPMWMNGQPVYTDAANQILELNPNNTDCCPVVGCTDYDSATSVTQPINGQLFMGYEGTTIPCGDLQGDPSYDEEYYQNTLGLGNSWNDTHLLYGNEGYENYCCTFPTGPQEHETCRDIFACQCDPPLPPWVEGSCDAYGGPGQSWTNEYLCVSIDDDIPVQNQTFEKDGIWIEGCIDDAACNYNPWASIDAGEDECDWSCYGCNDPAAINWGGVDITMDDGSCDYNYIFGCGIEGHINYDPNVTITSVSLWNQIVDNPPSQENYSGDIPALGTLNALPCCETFCCCDPNATNAGVCYNEGGAVGQMYNPGCSGGGTGGGPGCGDSFSQEGLSGPILDYTGIPAPTGGGSIGGTSNTFGAANWPDGNGNCCGHSNQFCEYTSECNSDSDCDGYATCECDNSSWNGSCQCEDSDCAPGAAYFCVGEEGINQTGLSWGCSYCPTRSDGGSFRGPFSTANGSQSMPWYSFNDWSNNSGGYFQNSYIIDANWNQGKNRNQVYCRAGTWENAVDGGNYSFGCSGWGYNDEFHNCTGDSWGTPTGYDSWGGNVKSPIAAGYWCPTNEWPGCCDSYVPGPHQSSCEPGPCDAGDVNGPGPRFESSNPYWNCIENDGNYPAEPPDFM